MAKNRINILLMALFIFQTGFDLMAAEREKTASDSEEKHRIKWFESYEAGMKAAKAQKRPAMISFNAPWCGWCEKMHSSVFAQPAVIAKLQKFVCIKVDVDEDRKVAFAYGVQSLPRNVVVNTSNEIVGDWLGYREAEQLLELLDDVSEYLYKPVGTMRAPDISPDTTRPSREPETVQIDPADSNALTELLGHRDVAVRTKVVEALVRQGPDILELLIPALESKYLGTRITAWKVVQKLKIAEVKFDPWALAEERAEAIAEFRKQIPLLKIKIDRGKEKLAGLEPISSDTRTSYCLSLGA